MTYSTLKNMKDYTDQGLKDKCAHPLLVCAFAVIFVVLTSLLIYVAWTPKTIEETIKINIEDVPEAHDLFQTFEDDKNLNSPENNLQTLNSTKGVSKNITALQIHNTFSKSDEKVHILDVDPTTTESPSDELIILILEDPESVDWPYASEKSKDFDSKLGQNSGEMESPWSIIKNSWYLETQVLNVSNKNGAIDDTNLDQNPKIFPDISDLLTIDKLFPFNDIWNPNPSDMPSTSSEDLKVNNPIKEMVEMLKKIVEDDEFSNVNETPEGPDLILDQDDSKVPVSLKDLIKKFPSFFKNPLIGNLLNDLFPETDNSDITLNFEVSGQNEDDMHPMGFQKDPLLQLLNLIKAPNGYFSEEISTSTFELDSNTKTSTEKIRQKVPKNGKAQKSSKSFFDEDMTKSVEHNSKVMKHDDLSKSTDVDTLSYEKHKLPKKGKTQTSFESLFDEDITTSVDLDSVDSKQDGRHKMADNKETKAIAKKYKTKEKDDSLDDSFEPVLDSPKPRKGPNMITDPDDNFNTYILENKISTTTGKHRANKIKIPWDKFEFLNEKSGNSGSPEDMFQDYVTTKKGERGYTQKIPVTDEEIYDF